MARKPQIQDQSRMLLFKLSKGERERKKPNKIINKGFS
jgi:hypothetical protein